MPLKFGIEKEYSLIRLCEHEVAYVLDSFHASKRLSEIGRSFLDNGWSCKQEYTYSIIEFVSPVYHVDELDKLFTDLSSLHYAVSLFNKNNSYVLSNQYSNVTPLYSKHGELTSSKSDIYLDDPFEFYGDLEKLPLAYTHIDKAILNRLYDGLISTDINFSFGRILEQDEIKVVAETMLDVSIKYELQKSFKDNFFFDGKRLFELECSARDYFLRWANPQRVQGNPNLCFTDTYTCRVKESEQVTIIECKNFHSCYEPRVVREIVSDIAKNLISLGFT